MPERENINMFGEITFNCDRCEAVYKVNVQGYGPDIDAPLSDLVRMPDGWSQLTIQFYKDGKLCQTIEREDDFQLCEKCTLAIKQNIREFRHG
jgi:hypothetical protein